MKLSMKEFYVLLGGAVAVVVTVLIWNFQAPPTSVVQVGPDGVAMEVVVNEETLAEVEAANNEYPEPIAAANPDGPRASEAYQNVQVLGDLSTGQFTRLMLAITQWVAPKEGPESEVGCNYCHYANNMASDGKYTKHVARRMIQMTQHINAEWKSHVGNVGATCYTCHRGQPVPSYVWYKEAPHEMESRGAGGRAHQNRSEESVGYASLPGNVFETYLLDDHNIRVIGDTPLPTGNASSIKQTEWTYGLMMHFSNALGVNCTYCHNSRAMAMWNQSPPSRAKAWYAIRMLRSVNGEYTSPLVERYPDYRLGPTGDAPKANCYTCHQGAYQPLLGYNMLEHYPSLSAPDYYAEYAAEYRKKKKAEEEAAAALEADEAAAEDGASEDEVAN